MTTDRIDAEFIRRMESVAKELTRQIGEGAGGHAAEMRRARASVHRAAGWMRKGSYIRAANSVRSAERVLDRVPGADAERARMAITHAELIWRARQATRRE